MCRSRGLPADADLVEDMILRTGADVLRRLESDLAQIGTTAVGDVWRYEHRGGELITTVEFTHIAPNDTGHARLIGMGGPGENFRAEPKFEELIGKIREKAEQRQASRGEGTIRGLSVDAGRTRLDTLLEMGRVKLSPSCGLDLDALELDFVALTVPRRGKHGPRRGVRADLLFEDTRITREQLGQLYD